MADKKILQYKDVVNIQEKENRDSLVVLQDIVPVIKCEYQKDDMFTQTGQNILIRSAVAIRLKAVAERLQKISNKYRLKVVYGYRSPKIQEKYFQKRQEELKDKYRNLSDEDLLELTHSFVASPDVAGHVTGGAVDITVEYSGQELDMGSDIANYEDEDIIKTFSDKITDQQLKNRLLLHDAMTSEGFAPFYGEWWHFSYGDREWACFYNKNESLYSAINLKI